MTMAAAAPKRMSCDNMAPFGMTELGPLRVDSSTCCGLAMCFSGIIGGVEQHLPSRRLSQSSTATSTNAGSDKERSDSEGSTAEGSDTEDSDAGAKSGEFQCLPDMGHMPGDVAHMSGPQVVDMVSELTEGFKSGDGTIESVGVVLRGEFHCTDCKQKFASEKALTMHCKFMHDGGQADMNVGYTLVYEFAKSKDIEEAP